MSEEINFLKDKHMLTLVEAEMVLYCEFALDAYNDLCMFTFILLQPSKVGAILNYSILVTYILLI